MYYVLTGTQRVTLKVQQLLAQLTEDLDERRKGQGQKTVSLSPNQGAGRAVLSPEAPGNIRCWPLPASSGCRHPWLVVTMPISEADLQISLCPLFTLPVPGYVFQIPLCVSLIRTLVTAFRDHPDNPG